MDIFLDILLKPPQPFIGLFFKPVSTDQRTNSLKIKTVN